MSQVQISKLGARQSVERIPEIRAGLVDIERSYLGFSPTSGEVWALISTNNGMVQYRGVAGEQMKRNTENKDLTPDEMMMVRSRNGFEDLSSKVFPSKTWEAAYRASPRRRLDFSNIVVSPRSPKRKGRPRGRNYRSPSPCKKYGADTMACVSSPGCKVAYKKRWKLFLPLIQKQTFQISQETFLTQKEKVLGKEKRPPTWPQLQITQ
jgi:hypothetical protein